MQPKLKRTLKHTPKHKQALFVSAALLLAGAGHAADINVNQVGFLPAAQKLAVVAAGTAARFSVHDAATCKQVLDGELGAGATWDASGETVRLADFSRLHTSGTYRIKVAGLADSAPFAIHADAYRELDAAALRSYYFQRSGIALEPRYAGAWARPAGHPDTRVLIHPSAATAKRPAGTVISSAKGWYDAGDYNKYIVNSGIATYTLLAAYEHFPQWFDKLQVTLPESGNGLPDVLNEALWNVEWMASMQDPDDGGVYHKLTNKVFDPMVMPSQATSPRYVVQKTTAAALDFAAVMATASRVLAPFEHLAGGRSARYLAAAEAAWRWAGQHPAVTYRQPADILTGAYDDETLDDEFSWAAAELLISTGKDAYRARAVPAARWSPTSEPSWNEVRALGWMSLAAHRGALPNDDAATAQQRIIAMADTLVARWKASPYRISMTRAKMGWGSNAVMLNQAMMLVQAYRLNARPDYLDAAQSALDYVLGRNAVGISFVTGFGAASPQHPHHRPSQADAILAPIPGLLVGGPNSAQQDRKNCGDVAYPSTLPALSYLDNVCSYASNEVAINWNAPLVYVAAALQVLQVPQVLQR